MPLVTTSAATSTLGPYIGIATFEMIDPAPPENVNPDPPVKFTLPPSEFAVQFPPFDCRLVD